MSEAKKGRKKPTAFPCICKGNWRAIVTETRPLYGRTFVRGGRGYQLIGTVDAADDYYYVMVDDQGRSEFLSCVGSIEGFGFAPIRQSREK